MNKLSIRLSLAALVTILPLGVALAAPALPSPTPIPPAVSTDDSSTHVNNLKSHGIAEADRRLSLLQTVALRLAASTQMTASEKSALAKRVDEQVAALGTFKSKLAAESDLSAARGDIQLVIDEYRIYGLLTAQISLVTAADRMIETQIQLQTVVTELQKKADVLKQGGKDTTELQKHIDAAKTSIATAQPLYSKLTAQILAYKASDYATDHKLLSGYRDSITTARDNFRTARSNIDAAVAAINKLK
jgi:hypothetical protein